MRWVKDGEAVWNGSAYAERRLGASVTLRKSSLLGWCVHCTGPLLGVWKCTKSKRVKTPEQAQRWALNAVLVHIRERRRALQRREEALLWLMDDEGV